MKAESFNGGYDSTRAKGDTGESYAVRMLKNSGHRVLCCNYKAIHGEIDIICERDSYIIFVEVKMREVLEQKPSDALSIDKIKHIKEAIDTFLSEYKENNYIRSLKPRIDVVEVFCKNGEISGFNHIKNADIQGKATDIFIANSSDRQVDL